MTDKNRDMSVMSLHFTDTLCLLLYYTLILTSSVGYLVYCFLKSDQFPLVDQFSAIKIVLASSFSGSTIFYSRKLYKAAISGSFNFLQSNLFTVSRLGTIFYFLLRPLFGSVFSIVVYSIWRSSVQVSTQGGATPNELIFLVIPIGFFAGFSAGRVLEQFESKPISDYTKTDGMK